MAAPEYLVKLKFGTEVDKKAFSELQAAYNQLANKQKAVFAKQYGGTVQEMDKIFRKEMASNLQSYERAAEKTERTLTAVRVRELRNYIEKRNQQLKRLPGFVGGSLATAGVATARSAIQNADGLTSFQKNRYSGMLTSGAALAGAGFMIGGPLGALAGGAIGAGSSLLMSEFSNGTEAIKRSATLFNDAVSTYRSTLDFTKGMTFGMAGAGFTDEGQYQVYKRALNVAGVDNDSWMNDLIRSLASQEETAELGKTLMGMRRDEALELLYQRWQESGLSIAEYVMGSTKSGGLNQSDMRADALQNIFKAGGMQAAINKVLPYVLSPGEDASTLSPAIRAANEKRVDLENREWAARMKQVKIIEDIDMNADIVKVQNAEFERSVALMNESNIILAGITHSYKTHAKELAEIFSYITKKTGTGTRYGETLKASLNTAIETGDFNTFYDQVTGRSNMQSRPMSMVNSIERASNRVNQTRIENSPLSINNF